MDISVHIHIHGKPGEIIRKESLEIQTFY